MFAGIVSLDNEPITERLRVALRSALSRRVDEEILEYARENVAFVRANTGALTTYSGLRHGEPDTVSLLAGQPLLSHESTEVDHERLDQALATGSFEPFRRARGTFCGAWFSDAGKTELCLFGIGHL